MKQIKLEATSPVSYNPRRNKSTGVIKLFRKREMLISDSVDIRRHVNNAIGSKCGQFSGHVIIG